MMKRILVVALLGITLQGFSQKYAAEKSFISFFSDGAIEDIAAENLKTTTLFNTSTGDIVFSIPIKEFAFDKSLMKEHFNEKYMETEKFPKATFQGKVVGFQMDKKGEQQATASGRRPTANSTRSHESVAPRITPALSQGVRICSSITRAANSTGSGCLLPSRAC